MSEDGLWSSYSKYPFTPKILYSIFQFQITNGIYFFKVNPFHVSHFRSLYSFLKLTYPTIQFYLFLYQSAITILLYCSIIWFLMNLIRILLNLSFGFICLFFILEFLIRSIGYSGAIFDFFGFWFVLMIILSIFISRLIGFEAFGFLDDPC